MEMESAYTLSDLYILKADKCSAAAEVHMLHKEAVLDFTNQMNKVARSSIYSKPIVMTMDYIYDHLHSKISEEEIAEYVSLSPSYLSRLFRSEVGVTVSTYIAVKRVETAQNMLKYSDYAPVDIGNYLAFNSHSFFKISIFIAIILANLSLVYILKRNCKKNCFDYKKSKQCFCYFSPHVNHKIFTFTRLERQSKSDCFN